MKKLFAVFFAMLFSTSVFAASNVLTWTDNSDNETTFSIERKQAACASTGGTYAEIGTVAANMATYTDSTVKEGLEYCYRVAAANTAGKSAFSNTAGRTVPFTVPAAPSGLTVQGGP